MGSLVLYVGTVSRFEPDSRCQLSTGPFSTARVPGLPHLPDTAVPLVDVDIPAATRVLVPTSGFSYPPPPPQQGHSGPASASPTNYWQAGWSPWEVGALGLLRMTGRPRFF